MNLWDAFFAVQPTEPPQLLLGWHLSLLVILMGIIYASWKHHQSASYQLLFRRIQLGQLVALYAWYWCNALPLSESLPLYHCRIAMFAVLFLPDRSVYKQYFALLGTFGSLVAIIHPIFDPYPFPHITILSFIIGHLALLGNSLNYLFNHFNSNRLSWQGIVSITVSLNSVLWFANQILRANYGFLEQPPIVGNHGFFVNFIIISLVLSLAISAFSMLLKRFMEVKETSLT